MVAGLSPVLCRYLPVRMLARLGQQIGVVTKALVNSTPTSLTSLLVATSGSVPPSSMSWRWEDGQGPSATWSSVRTRTMLGLGWEEARPRARVRRVAAMPTWAHLSPPPATGSLAASQL